MAIRRKQDLIDQITEYLANGGLFNPEYMDHKEVSKLLIDIRDYLMSNQVMDIEYIPTPPATGTHKCFLCGVIGVNGLACPAHNCPSRVTC